MGKRLSTRGSRASLGPLEYRIREEQVAMLYDRNRLPTLLGIPFGLFICAYAWAYGRHAYLVAWFALKVATAGSRLILDALYRRHRERTPAAAWNDRFVVALGLDGFAWSLLVVLFADPTFELGAVMVAIVICTGALGALATAMDRRANVVFAAALFLPGAVRVLLLGSRLGVFGGVALLLLLGLVIDYGVRAAAATTELLRLRFEVAQARDAALAAGKAKSDFLATMSHELRTPLNAVIGMASLLADTEMTADQRERLDVIRASGETLLTLIGDILDISKIEAGKLEVESAPVNLARVIEDALDQVAPAASAKGLEIGYELSDECPAAIVSDATRIRQILSNLLGNAIKFSERGSVTVNVAATKRDGDRTEVTFAVHDTGIGIGPETLGRLFVPFNQADATTTRRYGGTGLGLAICKSLSELLGGTIGVESALGEGSTFHFSVVGEALKQAHLHALPINAGARVCVVSDHATARALLVGHASRFGFLASPVASLDAAREIVAARETDLVLLDTHGGEDEVMREIRALREAGASVPILVLVPRTASRPPQTRFPDVQVAAVSKPARAGRLLDVMEALLAGQAAPTRQSSMADAEPLAESDSRGGSALIVDDNELNRRVAVEMVRRLGLSARAVASGAQAIEAVEQEAFDYVLMDVQMPDMDGFEATRRLLAVAGERRPRVIAMTANALPGDRERCLAAGMSDYVTKPVRPGALATALRRRYDGAPDGAERSGITDVLDAQVLEDLRMLEETSGASLIAELAASFREDVPARIEDMRTAAAAHDMAGVRSLAHRLRGSAGAVGANRVFMTATEIEAVAATSTPEALASLIGHLAKEVARTVDAFGRVIERVRRDKEKARDEGTPGDD